MAADQSLLIEAFDAPLVRRIHGGWFDRRGANRRKPADSSQPPANTRRTDAFIKQCGQHRLATYGALR